MPKKEKNISCRKFINIGVQGYAGVGLTHGVLLSLLAYPGCDSTKTMAVPGVCYHDSPYTCSWNVTVGNGNIKDFGASVENPFTDVNKSGRFSIDVFYCIFYFNNV